MNVCSLKREKKGFNFMNNASFLNESVNEKWIIYDKKIIVPGKTFYHFFIRDHNDDCCKDVSNFKQKGMIYQGSKVEFYKIGFCYEKINQFYQLDCRKKIFDVLSKVGLNFELQGRDIFHLKSLTEFFDLGPIILSPCFFRKNGNMELRSNKSFDYRLKIFATNVFKVSLDFQYNDKFLLGDSIKIYLFGKFYQMK